MRITEEQKEEILREAEILRNGISNEALELIKKQFGYGLDIFQFEDARGVPTGESAEVLMMKAQKRAGQHSVINWILQRRNNKKKVTK